MADIILLQKEFQHLPIVTVIKYQLLLAYKGYVFLLSRPMPRPMPTFLHVIRSPYSNSVLVSK